MKARGASGRLADDAGVIQPLPLVSLAFQPHDTVLGGLKGPNPTIMSDSYLISEMVYSLGAVVPSPSFRVQELQHPL